jgi:hypothetical protein
VEMFDKYDQCGNLARVYYKTTIKRRMDCYHVDGPEYQPIDRDLKLLTRFFYEQQETPAVVRICETYWLVLRPTKIYYEGQLMLTPNFFIHRKKDAKYKKIISRVSQDAEGTASDPYAMMKTARYLRSVVNLEMKEIRNCTYYNFPFYFEMMLEYMEKHAPMDSFVAQNVNDTITDIETTHIQFVPNLTLPGFQVNGVLPGSPPLLPLVYFCFGLELTKKSRRFVENLAKFCEAFGDEHSVTFTPLARKDKFGFLELYLIVKKSVQRLLEEGYDPDGEVIRGRPAWHESFGGFMNTGGAQPTFFTKCGEASHYYSYYAAPEDIVSLVIEEISKLRLDNEAECENGFEKLESFQGGTPSSIDKLRDLDGFTYVRKSSSSFSDNGMPSLIRQAKFMMMMNHKHRGLYPDVYSLEIAPDYVYYDMEYIGPSLNEAIQAKGDFHFLFTGLDRLLEKIWMMVGKDVRVLSLEESKHQFMNYYHRRVVPRIEEAKASSEILREILEQPFFSINGVKVANVYLKVLEIIDKIEEKQYSSFLPLFLVPFFHRDMNSENILVSKKNAEDFILIDCSGECLDEDGDFTWQELAPDLGKLCFGFAGYNSIIRDDFAIEELGRNEFTLSLGKRTRLDIVEGLLKFYECHPRLVEISNSLECHFFDRVKFNVIISFLADLKYRKTEEGKIANILQSSLLCYEMNLLNL